MADMSLQDRYDDVAAISGLSEEVIRRVYRATRTSLVKSLKHGERATLPGICTILPEVKNRVDLGGESMTSYIKLKAKPSSALETELEKMKGFDSAEDKQKETKRQEEGLSKLLFKDPELGVRTTQISALL